MASKEAASMKQIKHIAFASDHPGRAADFYARAFGWKEISRSNIDPDLTKEAPRPSGVFMTDGYMNIAILKFRWDQLGKGLDYAGLHHFGMIVEDTEAWTEKLEAMGSECFDGKVPTPGRHAELKFRGPDGVVFDITGSPWPGSAGG
jgi:catechol 2,3-dioxygenase-like lactoylglutathione lyase family enzyme